MFHSLPILEERVDKNYERDETCDNTSGRDTIDHGEGDPEYKGSVSTISCNGNAKDLKHIKAHVEKTTTSTFG